MTCPPQAKKIVNCIIYTARLFSIGRGDCFTYVRNDVKDGRAVFGVVIARHIVPRQSQRVCAELLAFPLKHKGEGKSKV